MAASPLSAHRKQPFYFGTAYCGSPTARRHLLCISQRLGSWPQESSVPALPRCSSVAGGDVNKARSLGCKRDK